MRRGTGQNKWGNVNEGEDQRDIERVCEREMESPWPIMCLIGWVIQKLCQQKEKNTMELIWNRQANANRHHGNQLNVNISNLAVCGRAAFSVCLMFWSQQCDSHWRSEVWHEQLCNSYSCTHTSASDRYSGCVRTLDMNLLDHVTSCLHCTGSSRALQRWKYAPFLFTSSEKNHEILSA